MRKQESLRQEDLPYMPREINLFEPDFEIEERMQLSENKLVAMLDRVKSRQDEEQEELIKQKQVMQLVEALLFASNEPLPLAKIREVTDTLHPLKPSTLKQAILKLGMEYREQNRSFELEEVGEGFILRTKVEYFPYLELLYRNRRGEKLSPASLETLSIIAYKQPCTRALVEQVRGVDSSSIIYSLMERGLVEIVGKLEAPGRPSLLGTTQKFLTYFGLKEMGDLGRVIN